MTGPLERILRARLRIAELKRDHLTSSLWTLTALRQEHEEDVQIDELRQARLDCEIAEQELIIAQARLELGKE